MILLFCLICIYIHIFSLSVLVAIRFIELECDPPCVESLLGAMEISYRLKWWYTTAPVWTRPVYPHACMHACWDGSSRPLHPDRKPNRSGRPADRGRYRPAEATPHPRLALASPQSPSSSISSDPTLLSAPPSPPALSQLARLAASSVSPQ